MTITNVGFNNFFEWFLDTLKVESNDLSAFPQCYQKRKLIHNNKSNQFPSK